MEKQIHIASTEEEPREQESSEEKSNYSGESLLDSDDFIPEVVTPQEQEAMKNKRHEKGF